MKMKLTKEYFQRVRKLLQSKIDGRNVICGTNTWAVSVLRYSASFVNWTRDELRVLDRNAHSSEGKPPQPPGNKQRVQEEKIEERMHEVKEKQLHGQFLRDMEGEASEKSWEWLEKCHLKKSNEGLIMAAQSQPLRTNAIKTKIDKTKIDLSCRLRKKNDETVNHLLSECLKLGQTEYKRRHDNVAKGNHWDLCKHYGVECGDKWYEHVPEPVVESSDVKILWDFTIQTDKKLPHNKPDIVVVKKTSRTCHIIDVACPGDCRIRLKEEEKVNKYRDLAFEVKTLWKMKKVTTTPIVIGALGTSTDRLEKYLEDIQLGFRPTQCRRPCCWAQPGS